MSYSANPRHRVQRNANARGDDDDNNEHGTQLLKPGHVRIESYCKPPLQAGTYKAEATLKVSAPEEPDTNASTTQTFTVVIPQFSLPKGSLHSVYPPPGGSVPGRVLPHIIFHDPHFPWECSAVKGTNIPWLAVLVFTQNELTLSKEEREGMFAKLGPLPPQSSTLSVSLKVSDFCMRLPEEKVIVPNFTIGQKDRLIDGIDGDSNVNAIFLALDLFKGLFTSNDIIALERYEHLAHVRTLHTHEMAQSGTDQIRRFSLILSHRTGPLKQPTPTDVIAHLVSLEHMSEMNLSSFSASTTNPRIGLVSLHSWSYKCLPANALDLRQQMQHIGKQANEYLRSSHFSPLLSDNAMKKRLEMGYSLVRYRTHAGKETVAFTRGPLVPVQVPNSMIAKWPSQSDSGMDFQLLDQETGIMDITYSVAWHLGRSLGIGNRSFRSALFRLRAQIHHAACTRALGTEADLRSKESVLTSLRETVDTLVNHVMEGGSTVKATVPEAPSRGHIRDPTVEIRYREQVKSLAKAFAGSRDSTPHNESNSPTSSDWSLVLHFILDLLFLTNIPSQYLLPDPSYLPKESLRFFYTDENWLNCVIDGALSIGNYHTSNDFIRTAIKENFDTYCSTPVNDVPPQLPRFGCFLRSDIVKTYPDLIVRTSAGQGKRKPLVLLERPVDDTLLCLFDRVPGDMDFTSLKFIQPAHQLTFRLGEELNAEKLVMTPWKSRGDKTFAITFLCSPAKEDGKTAATPSQPPIYDWDRRTINMTDFQAWISSCEIKTEGRGTISLTSAAVAGQLSDPQQYVTINITPHGRQILAGRSGVQQGSVREDGKKHDNPQRGEEKVQADSNMNTASMSRPIGMTPVLVPRLPRSPNLPRLRPCNFHYSKFPMLQEVSGVLSDFFTLHLNGKNLGDSEDERVLAVVDLRIQSLLIPISILPKPKAKFQYPVSEIILQFSTTFPPKESPSSGTPSDKIVPFLSPIASTNINVGKGVLGNSQGWWNVVLQRCEKCFLLRFVARAGGEVDLSEETMDISVLLREFGLAGVAGRCRILVTVVCQVAKEGSSKTTKSMKKFQGGYSFMVKV
jgi:hypothetical protein